MTKYLQSTIENIAKINNHSYSLSEKWKFIIYLDTGNITKNIVGAVQYIDTTKDDVPLRARRKVSENDIIYSTVRPNQQHYGFIKEHVKNMLVSTGFAVISVNEKKAYSKFIYYCITQNKYTEKLQTIAEQNVSTYPTIKPSDLESLEIPLPPLDVQKRIAGILGALDDKIEVLRAQNKTLEQMAQAVFQSWFVDFDIVRAKAAGLPAADVCKKYHITPDIYDLFPSAFSADNLPLGWEKIPFSETMNIISGGTPKTTEPTFWNGEIPWYSVVDAPASIYVLDTEKHITQQGLEKSPCSLLEKDTVIISARGTVGKLAVVGKQMAMNQSCYGLKFDFPYYGYLMTKQMLIGLKQNVHGAVFDTITKDTFKTVQTVNVSKNLKEAFTNIVSSFFKKIFENSKQIHTLEQTRDTLLPQLLGGKLDVKNVSLSILDNRI